MTRRRIVRPAPEPTPLVVNPGRVQKLRDRVEVARQALARWLARLKRACRAVEKNQAQITRLERRIKKLEET